MCCNGNLFDSGYNKRNENVEKSILNSAHNSFKTQNFLHKKYFVLTYSKAFSAKIIVLYVCNYVKRVYDCHQALRHLSYRVSITRSTLICRIFTRIVRNNRVYTYVAWREFVTILCGSSRVFAYCKCKITFRLTKERTRTNKLR